MSPLIIPRQWAWMVIAPLSSSPVQLLYEPLTHLFNLSVTNHCLPAERKLHGITPIYKAGDRSSVKNYRPISLLSSTSKVLECIIYKCAEFLHPKISKHQFGFLPKHSTLQQLLLFCNSILDNLRDQMSYIWISPKLSTQFPTRSCFTS